MRLMLSLGYGISKSRIRNKQQYPIMCSLFFASQNHEHASKIALLDKTLFSIKSCSHILRAASWWTVHHAKGHIHEPITAGIFWEQKRHKWDATVLFFGQFFLLVLWQQNEMNTAAFTTSGHMKIPKIILNHFFGVIKCMSNMVL